MTYTRTPRLRTATDGVTINSAVQLCESSNRPAFPTGLDTFKTWQRSRNICHGFAINPASRLSSPHISASCLLS